MISITPATRDDVVRFYGGLPGHSIRALVALDDDGEVLAVGGIAFSQGYWVAFYDATEAFRADRRALVRALRAFRLLTEDKDLVAEIDDTFDGADVLLRHAGLEHSHEGIYRSCRSCRT